MLGTLSRLINRMTGGFKGQTLCARIAAAWGSDCLACRLIDRFTEPGHCAYELKRWTYS